MELATMDKHILEALRKDAERYRHIKTFFLPMDGPAQLLTVAGGKTPDEALGHEARHALQRWRHGAFMTNSEGVCE